MKKCELICSTFSQCDLTNGKSACTYIALAGVQILLPHINTSSSSSYSSSSLSNINITPDIISRCLFEGAEKYQLYHDNNGNGGVEHTSPEEVLPFYDNTIEWVDNKVEQGMLGLNNNLDGNAIGLLPLLSKVQQHHHYDNGYCAIVITKPPETIVTFLPPLSNSTNKNDNNDNAYYILFDSHSRPNIVDGGGAYMKIHNTINDLIKSIEDVFPAVDLNDDGLNMIYNSFDLYLLRCK